MTVVSTRRLWLWLGLVLMLFAAYAVRLYRIDTVPLRGDEGYTAIHGTAMPLTAAWIDVMETQPNPGMLTAYWLWTRAAGLSEFSLRYINLLHNVAGLAVMVALAHRLQRNWKTAALVGLLWLLNPFFIWHAQDARHYAFTTLFTPLSFYLFLRALDRDQRRDWFIYLIVQTLALYINILDAYYMVAQGLYLLSLHRADRFRHAVIIWIGMAVLLIPLAAQVYVVRVLNDYGGAARSANLRLFFEDFIATLLFGENNWPAWLGALALAVLVAGTLRFARRRVLLLSWLLIPFALLYAFSTGTSIFQPRYVINSVPALLLALVITVEGIGKRLAPCFPARSWLAAASVAIVSLISIVEVYDYFYTDPPKAADWRGLVTYLDERATARDVILSDSIDPALEYYYDGPAQILFIPIDNPEPEIYLPDALETYEAIYVLAGNRTGAAARYLQEHAQPVPGDTWRGVSQFRPWPVSPEEIETPLELQFGDVAILRGVTIIDDTNLLLYWEALAQTEVEHSVLLHIESAPDAPLAAALDHGIAGAVISTRTWTPGTRYRDPVALPDLPAGTYTVLVGMYATESGTPLLAEDSPEDGRVPIATLVFD